MPLLTNDPLTQLAFSVYESSHPPALLHRSESNAKVVAEHSTNGGQGRSADVTGLLEEGSPPTGAPRRCSGRSITVEIDVSSHVRIALALVFCKCSARGEGDNVDKGLYFT